MEVNNMTDFLPGAGTHNLSEKIQSFYHNVPDANPLCIEIVLEPTNNVYVCTRAIGTTVPTANPYDNVYWAVQAQFIKVDGTSATATIYYNTGTRASPSWTATDTAITETDILALIGDLKHAHTSSAIGTFAGTAATADDTQATHDLTASTNGTPLYVSLRRGDTSPAVLVSENANAATANFATDGGLAFPVVNTLTEDTDITLTHEASPETYGGTLFIRPTGGPNRWGAMEGEFCAYMTSQADISVATATPTDGIPIRHFEEYETIVLPLSDARELAANDIQNLAAHGGTLAKDSTPILQTVNAGTDGTHEAHYAVNIVDVLSWSIELPQSFNGYKDVLVKILAKKGSDLDEVSLNINTYWDGTKISDSVTDIPAAETLNVVTVETAAAMQGAKRLAVELYPGAHDDDTLQIYGVAVSYAKIADGLIPVYYDEDATADERFLHSDVHAKDIYIRLKSGRLMQVKYSATAAADGVAVYVDDDAGLGAGQYLLFISPTASNGTATSGTADGLFAIDGIYIGAVYVNETTHKLEFVNPATCDVPVWSIFGNRELKVFHSATAVADGTRAYFDDDAASQDERILANFTDITSHDVQLETAEKPFWSTPVGTIAVTPTVNDSAALIP